MVRVKFNLRNTTKEAATNINCVIRWNGQRLLLGTGLKVKPKLWDKELGLPTQPTSKLYKNLEQLKAEIERQYNYILDYNERQPSQLELKEIATKLFNPSKEVFAPKSELITDFVAKFIEQSSSRYNANTKRKISVNTIATYKQCEKAILSYQKHAKRALTFKSIDLDFYADFKLFMQAKGLNPNTIGKRIATLKAFLNAANEQGLTENQSHNKKSFKVDRLKVDNIYLNDTELNAIQGLNLVGNERLEKARDLFLVGCYTGLRFSDFVNIKPENFVDGFLKLTTQKTGDSVAIPIHSVLKQILEKYKGKTLNSLPPAISNQKLNKYIKEFCALVLELQQTVVINNEIKPKYSLVSCHTARRSFATNQYKNGLQAQTIMQVTGHRTEKAFMTYLKLDSTEYAELMQQHWDKQTKNSLLKVVS